MNLRHVEIDQGEDKSTLSFLWRNIFLTILIYSSKYISCIEPWTIRHIRVLMDDNKSDYKKDGVSRLN